MKGKKKRKSGEEKFCKRYEAELEKKAQNRRDLLAKLDPKTAKFAQQQFAKLGLFQ